MENVNFPQGRGEATIKRADDQLIDEKHDNITVEPFKEELPPSDDHLPYRLHRHHSLTHHLLSHQTGASLNRSTHRYILQKTYNNYNAIKHIPLLGRPDLPWLAPGNQTIYEAGINDEPFEVLDFDSRGELLLVAASTGHVAIYASRDLLSYSTNTSTNMVDPVLALWTGITDISAAKWNPLNENIIAITHTSSPLVKFYDLEYTQGSPCQTLEVPHAPSGSNMVGSTARGLHSFIFLSTYNNSGSSIGHKYIFAAGSSGGQILLWDGRIGGRPVLALQTPPGRQGYRSPVTSLHQAGGGTLLVAATSLGDISVWDLKGGAHGTNTIGRAAATVQFGRVLTPHKCVKKFNIHAALAAVPGLLEETPIKESLRLHHCVQDPNCEHRFAFQMSNGWAGVFDLLAATSSSSSSSLGAAKVTHLYAPPQPQLPVNNNINSQDGGGTRHVMLDSQNEVPTAHGTQQQQPPAPVSSIYNCKGCWLSGGDTFVAPYCNSRKLAFLDFSPGTHAGCAVDDNNNNNSMQDEWHSSFRYASQIVDHNHHHHHHNRSIAIQSAVLIDSPCAGVTCVGAHPNKDTIIAGSFGDLRVMGMVRNNEEDGDEGEQVEEEKENDVVMGDENDDEDV